MRFAKPEDAARWLCEWPTSTQLEIGSSYGTFLVSASKDMPQSRILGVEIVSKKCDAAAGKIAAAKIHNAAVLCCEAEQFVTQHVPSDALERVHVYYPTPYPKELGLQRRLLGDGFLGQLARVLRLGGELRIVTDHRVYYREIIAAAEQHEWRCVPWDIPLDDPAHGTLMGGGCEREYAECRLRSPLALRIIKL